MNHRNGSNRPTGAKLHQLIEQALKRPPHRPKATLPHVADEYTTLGGEHRAQDCACGHCIGAELRRGLRRGAA